MLRLPRRTFRPLHFPGPRPPASQMADHDTQDLFLEAKCRRPHSELRYSDKIPRGFAPEKNRRIPSHPRQYAKSLRRGEPPENASAESRMVRRTKRRIARSHLDCGSFRCDRAEEEALAAGPSSLRRPAAGSEKQLEQSLRRFRRGVPCRKFSQVHSAQLRDRLYGTSRGFG